MFNLPEYHFVNKIQYFVPVRFPCEYIDTTYSLAIQKGISYNATYTVDLVDISSTYGVRVLAPDVPRSYSWVGSYEMDKCRIVTANIWIGCQDFDSYSRWAPCYFRVTIDVPIYIYTGTDYMTMSSNDFCIDVSDFSGTLKTTSDTSTPLFQYYDSYGTIYPYASGTDIGDFSSDTQYLDTMGTFVGNTPSDPNTMVIGAVRYTSNNSAILAERDTQQAIRDTASDTQQAITDTAQATQDTIAEETEKQTGAIGGFFETLLNGIKEFFTGLFIPEDIGTSAFTDLLEDKLGFIYQVPSMLLSFLGTMFSAFSSGGAQTITFPGWSFGGYTFMEEYVINRSDYQAIFNVIDPVFTLVGTILVVFAFCSGVKKLYNRILGGVDNS